MGARFDIKHTNILGYLTDYSLQEAPRVPYETLEFFLMSFKEGGDSWGPTLFTSENAEWLEALVQTARNASESLRNNYRHEEILRSDSVAKLLYELRRLFLSFPLFVCVRGHEKSKGSLYWEMASEIGELGLFMFPDGNDSINEFIDPTPIVQTLADALVKPPLALVWTPNGESLSMSLNEADEFFDMIFSRYRGIYGFGSSYTALDWSPQLNERQRHFRDSVTYDIKNWKRAKETRKILHMSDLHFGTKEARQSQTYLKRSLRRTIRESIDQVVITGDLFDRPKRGFKQDFENFRSDLQALTKNEVIVIPGNHDVRQMGNKLGPFGERFKEWSGVTFKPVHVNHDLKTIFLCFNSAEEGNIARGKVTRSQRLKLANEYRELIDREPVVETYLKVSLVHHHPIPYEKGGSGHFWYEKILKNVGYDIENFLAFEDAESFLDWNKDLGISLILHGHKHLPRQTQISNGPLVIGCGSTTGAGGSPMCYDIITLDPKTKRWSAEFYQDIRGDGAGFKIQSVIIAND